MPIKQAYKAKFHRVKCGEWRPKNKGRDLKKNQTEMINNTLKKAKHGDIIYIEYIDKEIPNIWNGFRVYVYGKLYSIGGNPSLKKIDYTIYPPILKEELEELEALEIPQSDITKILSKKTKLTKQENDILQVINQTNYVDTFKYEQHRYKMEYEKELKTEKDIWDSYGYLSPSRTELIMLKDQIKRVKAKLV